MTILNTRPRVAAVGAVLVALSLVATGCSSSGNSGNTTAPTTSSATSAATSASASAGGSGSSTAPSINDIVSGTPTASLSGKTIAFLTCAAVVPFCAHANDLFTSTLKKRGATVLTFISNYDPAQQAQQLNQALTQKADAIVIITFSQATLRPGLIKAKSMKVPVVFLGTPADPDIASAGLMTSYVGANDVLAGTQSADAIVQGLKAEGKTKGNIIVLNGTAGQTTSDNRQNGIAEGLKKYPGFKVVGTGYTNYDPTKAGPLVSQLFTQHGSGGIDAIWVSAGGSLVPGVITAVKQLGKSVGSGGVLIATLGCDKVSNAAMEAGDLYADSALTVPSFAVPGANAAGALALGQTLPKTIYTPTPVFLKADLPKYKAACQLS